MKTTIEIPDPLFREIKKVAAERGTTIKILLETALRQMLKGSGGKQGVFKLRQASFKGEGLCEGLLEGDWDEVRSHIYSGRGTR